MKDIRVIGKGTLYIGLTTKDGRYASFTQYNTGYTVIVINGLSLEELDALENAVAEMKVNLKGEVA